MTVLVHLQKNWSVQWNICSDISYRILNFISVFGALNQYVKCNGNAVKFTEGNHWGLGFKILINYDNCMRKEINMPSYRKCLRN